MLSTFGSFSFLLLILHLFVKMVNASFVIIGVVVVQELKLINVLIVIKNISLPMENAKYVQKTVNLVSIV